MVKIFPYIRNTNLNWKKDSNNNDHFIWRVFLAVLAMAWAGCESKANVRNIIGIVERLCNDWENLNTLPDYNKLMDKQLVIINGKEGIVGRLVKLLHIRIAQY